MPIRLTMLGPLSYIVHTLDVQSWASRGCRVSHTPLRDGKAFLYDLGKSSPHELPFGIELSPLSIYHDSPSPIGMDTEGTKSCVLFLVGNKESDYDS